MTGAPIHSATCPSGSSIHTANNRVILGLSVLAMDTGDTRVSEAWDRTANPRMEDNRALHSPTVAPDCGRQQKPERARRRLWYVDRAALCHVTERSKTHDDALLSCSAVAVML